MRYWKSARQTIATVLVAALVSMNGGQGWAMLAPAAAPESSSTRLEDAAKVQKFLHHKVVQQRLVDYGLSEAEAEARMQRLTDQELRQVALQIDQQNPGGDASGLVITVLLIGVLALMFIYFAKRV